MGKNLSLSACADYIEKLSEKHKLTKDVQDMLTAQLKVLKKNYGDVIPKNDFLSVMGRQLEMQKTGYLRKPVDMGEFLLSPDYLNLSRTIRPVIRDELIEIFDNRKDVFEVCCYGGTRWGKTYLISCGIARCLYHLSCLVNPQVHYNLAPGSEIVIALQSVNKEKSMRNFREITNLLDHSPYFQKHFPTLTRASTFIKFPHNIVIKAVASNNVSVMSENVIAGFMDEISFMKVIKGSRFQGTDEDYYDQAAKLYNTLRSRIENQFKDHVTGTWPGKLFLASSANTTDDFLYKKKQEAKENSNIYVMDYALWEVKDTDKLSGEKFWVQVPDDAQAGKILEEKPDYIDETVIEVPVEYREQFDRDLFAAIRDVAGKPITRSSKFIPAGAIQENINSYKKHFGEEQIFTVPECVINETYLSGLINKDFAEAIAPFAKFHMHVDVGIETDSAGLALVGVFGSKKLGAEMQYMKEIEEFAEKTRGELPIYICPGMLRITPPNKGQTDIERIQELICLVKESLPSFTTFSCDTALSTSLKQNVRKYANVTVENISVDKNTAPYFEMKSAIVSGCAWVPDHAWLKDEIRYLQLHSTTGKVDHLHYKSKDLSDSLAAAIYKLSKRKSTYLIGGTPYTLREMKEFVTEEVKQPQKQERAERPRSKNRPRRR